MRTLLELTTNMETVRSIAGGSFLKERWNDSTKESARIGLLNRAAANFAVNFATSSLQISMIGIVVVGVFLISSLKITTGALVACVILSGRVLSPLVQTGQLLTRFNSAITAFNNVDELMKEESRDEVLEGVKGVILDKGNIEVKNLNYSINESKITPFTPSKTSSLLSSFINSSTLLKAVIALLNRVNNCPVCTKGDNTRPDKITHATRAPVVIFRLEIRKTPTTTIPIMLICRDDVAKFTAKLAAALLSSPILADSFVLSFHLSFKKLPPAILLTVSIFVVSSKSVLILLVCTFVFSLPYLLSIG
jgi:hypothetical protein